MTSKGWFTQWVTKALGYIQSAALDDMETVVLLQVTPEIEDEKTFARTEWPEFLRLLEECYKKDAYEVKNIKFEDIQRTQENLRCSVPAPLCFRRVYVERSAVRWRRPSSPSISRRTRTTPRA